MTDSDKEVLLQWLQKAEHDLIAAEINIFTKNTKFVN